MIGCVAVIRGLDQRHIPSWTPPLLHRRVVSAQRTTTPLHPHHIRITPKPAQFAAPAELHHIETAVPCSEPCIFNFVGARSLHQRIRSVRRGELNSELRPAVRAGTAEAGYGCEYQLESSETLGSVEAQRGKCGISLDQVFY